MRKRVRAVIVQDKKILTIKRVKNNETYFVLPGGGIENSEDEKSALIRECLEEINVDVVVGDLIFEQQFNGNEELFYLCDIVGGTVEYGNGEEYENMSESNSYEPTWLSLDNGGQNIRPLEIVGIIKKIY